MKVTSTLEHEDYQSGDSIPHDEENELDDVESAEEIEESLSLPRWSERARRTPVCFPDTVIVAAEDPMMYVESVRGSKEN